MKKNIRQFTAVYKKSGKWYIGWIEKIPGVNTQGATIKELKENLKDALHLILKTNKLISDKQYSVGILKREEISVCV